MPSDTNLARLMLLLASTATLTACSWVKPLVSEPVPPAHMLTAYFDDDFRLWKGAGGAGLTGQAFFKTPDGRIVSCAGDKVTLLPATQYNTELEQYLGMGTGYPADYGRKAHLFNHEAVCDPAGHFQFEKIPAGLNWIVLTRVTWKEEPDLPMVSSVIPMMSDGNKGGYLFQEVVLAEGSNKVILSNADFVKDKD